MVELCTSEGGNTCPPADHWFSSLNAEPGVVALAFHVDSWDHLDWKDRFARPAYTQRQAQLPSRGKIAGSGMRVIFELAAFNLGNLGAIARHPRPSAHSLTAPLISDSQPRAGVGPPEW